MGNPMDVDAAQKAYAKAQVSEIMPFSQFVKHIADHNLSLIHISHPLYGLNNLRNNEMHP